MIDELARVVTAPVRVGLSLTRTLLGAGPRAAGALIDLVRQRDDHGEGPGVTVPVERTRPRPAPRAVPDPAAPSPRPAPDPAAAATAVADARIDGDEPELVAEFAEEGAEEGAGAEIEIQEPWDGYSGMTAAQIRKRLGGAGPEELAAVQLYEAAHRNRRSVLEAAERRLRES